MASAERNPLRVMEDPLAVMLRDLLSLIDPGYRVASVSVKKLGDFMRIEAVLKPRKEGATISAWRIIEMEDRIMGLMGFDAELVHTRIGVSQEGLLVVFMFKKPKFRKK